jgi:hypothetical protein
MTVAEGSEKRKLAGNQQHHARNGASKRQLKKEKERAGRAFERSWKNVTEKQSKKPPIG